MATTNKDHRVVFSIDDEAYRTLERFTAIGGFESMGDALGHMLKLCNALQGTAIEGFTELRMRNPKTKEIATMNGKLNKLLAPGRR